MFKLLDPTGSKKINRDDFARFVYYGAPFETFLQRVRSNIVSTSNARLLQILIAECQEADTALGCNGTVPLPVFKTIMKDYSLPFVAQDMQ